MGDVAINRTYYDALQPSYLGTAEKIHKTLSDKVPFHQRRNQRKKTSLKKIKKWLQSQDTHTLHKPVIRNFKRNPYRVMGIDSLWECDLVDMSMYKGVNDGFSYLFCVIDVFSKTAFVKLLRNKTARSVVKAFREILIENNRQPQTLQSDRGLEFKNKDFKSFLSSRGIKLQFPQTTSKFKCAVVEAFNKTLKGKMFKFFTSKGENYHRYIDILPQLVEHYNNSYHRTIKMKPVEVRPENTTQVYQNTHRYDRKEKISLPKLSERDRVRVARKHTTFQRGYADRWTKEIFIIAKVITKIPFPLYRLKDVKNREITGKFYEHELQQVR